MHYVCPSGISATLERTDNCVSLLHPLNLTLKKTNVLWHSTQRLTKFKRNNIPRALMWSVYMLVMLVVFLPVPVTWRRKTPVGQTCWEVFVGKATCVNILCARFVLIFKTMCAL